MGFHKCEIQGDLDEKERCESQKFARPWPRPCHIMNIVLLTLIHCMFFDHVFGTFAIETKSNNVFKQMFGTNYNGHQIRTTCCARTVVGCLRGAHAKNPLCEPPDMSIRLSFHVGVPFLELFSESVLDKQ